MSTKPKHPEPTTFNRLSWRDNDKRFGEEPTWCMITEAEEPIAITFSRDPKYREALANRIIKCLDACEGIEDPALFIAVVKKLIPDLPERVAQAGADVAAFIQSDDFAAIIARAEGGKS